ncbi:MAG: hypothetical protein WC453_05025 [Patescibacteria group bacterium]
MADELKDQSRIDSLENTVKRLEAQLADEGDSDVFGRWITGGAGSEPLGTKELYKVPVLREYDEDGNLVAIGAETDPLPAGHSLKWTWDWVRAH